jgi:hypothetical protein
MMEVSAGRPRYEKVLERMANACEKSGRKIDDVRLVAVSKFHPAADVERVVSYGQIDFGENYVQEAMQKRNELDLPDLRWHMIGHVQSRKAPAVAGKFVLLHTLDSIKLSNALEKTLNSKNIGQTALIEVNIGGEEQKSGVMANELPQLVEHVLAHCPHLKLEGLMCLPPVFDAGEAARPFFARLRLLRDELRKNFDLPLPQLSMGMSGDFEWAIAEGATIVRVGTDIFGPRPPKMRDGLI